MTLSWLLGEAILDMDRTRVKMGVQKSGPIVELLETSHPLGGSMGRTPERLACVRGAYCGLEYSELKGRRTTACR